MPHPIRGAFVESFTLAFALMKLSLPPDICKKIRLRNQRHNNFVRDYFGSIKIPDVGVFFDHGDDGQKIGFILEVGFTESYESLVEDARLWLEGNPRTNAVVLVKIEESPAYKCPIEELSEEVFDKIGFDEKNIDEADFETEGLGPVVYKGLTWMNTLSAIYMEVWKRRPDTGLAQRHGPRMVYFSHRASISYTNYSAGPSRIHRSASQFEAERLPRRQSRTRTYSDC